MAKSFLNTIDTAEIGLGITRLHIAPQDTVWSPARVNATSPAASFYDLGPVVDDSPVLRVTREKFKLITGIPRSLQYQTVMGMEGSLSAMLESFDYSKWEYAMGNTLPDTSNWDTTPGASDYVIQYYGTAYIKEFVVLGVTDFINGSQIVWHIPRATPADELEEMYKPDQEGRVPLNFEILSKTTTISSVDQLILAVRYQFGPDGTGV